MYDISCSKISVEDPENTADGGNIFADLLKLKYMKHIEVKPIRLLIDTISMI